MHNVIFVVLIWFLWLLISGFVLFFFYCYICVDGQPLEWKLCKSFQSKGIKVLDAQFGVFRTNLKMVRLINRFFSHELLH